MRVLCLILSLYLVAVNGVYISNLNESCFQCLCSLYGCQLHRGCSDGYCGPFYISRVYWAHAGKPTIPDDDPDRANSYQDCARSYECAKRTITNYIEKYGKDCNRDGVTDCFDFIMMNYNGKNDCTAPLFLSWYGRLILVRFKECRLY